MTILVCNILCAVCLWFLLCAIAINFYLAKRNGIQKEKKSVVETGSMLLFFVLMVAIVLFKLFAFEASASVRTVFAVIGTIVILFGTAVNIGGRLYLKGNWGNQIRIYKDHTLVTNGIYRYVRHPLYASTIAMIYGFSFLYVNPLVFLLNSVSFCRS